MDKQQLKQLLKFYRDVLELKLLLIAPRSKRWNDAVHIPLLTGLLDGGNVGIDCNPDPKYPRRIVVDCDRITPLTKKAFASTFSVLSAKGGGAVFEGDGDYDYVRYLLNLRRPYGNEGVERL